MPKGPWYISASAVRDYLGVLGKSREQTDGPEFERAERELMEFAARAHGGDQEGKLMRDTGFVQFRGPRPLRVRLLVNLTPRGEGNMPQLVAVKPDHEGRSGAYSRSAPARKRGHDK